MTIKSLLSTPESGNNKYLTPFQVETYSFLSIINLPVDWTKLRT
ncbi:hypothetical protein ANA_C11639 [Anabaena sp. 90]|nr:hypothetical protein ANA_C11639 [Anabaena sp. 90]